MPISQEKQRLLDQMEPLVQRLFDCCDESVVEELVKLNQKMIETNLKEDLMPVEHCIPVPHLVRANRQRMRLTNIMQNSVASVEGFQQAEAAREQLQSLQSELQKYMIKLMLPPSWAFEMTEVDIHQSAGWHRLSDANNWIPGQTTMGEEILGYRADTTTGISARTGEPGQVLGAIRFVIRVKKPNPIEIVNEARVGVPAVMAYLRLPREQKCNIARIDRQYNRMDSSRLGDIMGVAHSPYGTTHTRLPWGVIWILYDGQPRLMDRTGLRLVKGRDKADKMINKFLESIGEERSGPMGLRN